MGLQDLLLLSDIPLLAARAGSNRPSRTPDHAARTQIKPREGALQIRPPEGVLMHTKPALTLMEAKANAAATEACAQSHQLAPEG
jgi:hypothetical protein